MVIVFEVAYDLAPQYTQMMDPDDDPVRIGGESIVIALVWFHK